MINLLFLSYYVKIEYLLVECLDSDKIISS